MPQRGRCTNRFNPHSPRALAVAALLAVSLTTGAGAAPLFRSPFRSYDLLPPGGPFPIALVDVNRDGKLDLVSAPAGYPFRLGVWLGQADFGLGEPTYFLGGNGESIAFADMDGDGEADALVSGYQIGFYHARGDGTFGPYRVISTFDGWPGPMCAADLNGDGVLDVVMLIKVGWSDLVVRLGRGGGAVDSSADYRLPARLRGTGLAVADVNSDGLLDVLVSGDTGLGCVFLPGTGNGGLGPAIPIGPGGHDLLTGDFNHDGHLDLVTGRYVYLGHGDGTFAPGSPLAVNVVAAGDFDADGNLDLVALHAVSVEILRGNGDGTFTSRGEFPCGPGPWGVAMGDMNGDGRLDLAVSLAPPALSVLVGDGTGGFGDLPVVPTGAGPRMVVLGDVTGDGVPDLVTADRGARRIGIRPALGGGTFGVRAEIEAAPGLRAAILADLDGDGLRDLVSASDSSSTISTYLRLPGGGFGARRDFPAGGTPVALAAGDYDEDGHLDIVNANEAEGTSGFLRGDGAGGLAAAKTATIWNNGVDVAATDFNNDGHLDLVTVISDNGYGGRAMLQLGDGAGRFGWPYPIAYGRNPTKVAIADLDRNGWKDVVVAVRDSAGSTYGTLEIELMDARGGIGSHSYPIGVAPADVIIADLDGDGILDVACAGSAVNAVSVLRGRSDGSFCGRVDYGVADGPVSLAAADLNGDGAPELVVACERSNNVTVLENLIPSMPTPVLIALIESAVDVDGVRLVWQVAVGPGLDATIYRRDEAGAWEPRAVVHADGSGMVRYADPDVAPGQRYAYRLGYSEQTTERFSAEVWITVPQRARLALQGCRPNPALADLPVAFSLPDGALASLELLDVTGRVLERREVGEMGAGDHVMALGAGLGLRPGIYLIRLVHGPVCQSARAVVIR